MIVHLFQNMIVTPQIHGCHHMAQFLMECGSSNHCSIVIQYDINTLLLISPASVSEVLAFDILVTPGVICLFNSEYLYLAFLPINRTRSGLYQN